MNGKFVGFSRYNDKLNTNERASCWWTSNELSLNKKMMKSYL